MSTPLRECWRNCASETDEEILAIDAREDALAPLDDDSRHIRSLITHLETCHFRAGDRVRNILEAIGKGHTPKGPGRREPTLREPFEHDRIHAMAVLTAWCAGCPADRLELLICGVPAGRWLRHVGERTPLKEWQAGRVIDKLRSFVHCREQGRDPSASYVPIVGHPERYREHADFREATLETVIHDKVDGQPAEISLADAIDNLEGCNWQFPVNLEIVLRAIGGDIRPKPSFAVHRRNLSASPVRRDLARVATALHGFCSDDGAGAEADPELATVLGEPTPVKRWLAASLEKTLRMQLGL